MNNENKPTVEKILEELDGINGNIEFPEVKKFVNKLPDDLKTDKRILSALLSKLDKSYININTDSIKFAKLLFDAGVEAEDYYRRLNYYYSDLTEKDCYYDRAFLLETIKHHPVYCQLVPKTIAEDPTFWKEAIVVNPYISDFLPTTIKLSPVVQNALKPLFLKCIKKDACVFNSLPKEMRGDLSFCKEALAANIKTISYIPNSIITDPEFQGDMKRLLLAAFRRNAGCYKLIPKYIAEDPTFQREALCVNYRTFKHFPVEVKNNTVLQLELVRNYIKNEQDFINWSHYFDKKDGEQLSRATQIYALEKGFQIFRSIPVAQIDETIIQIALDHSSNKDETICAIKSILPFYRHTLQDRNLVLVLADYLNNTTDYYKCATQLQIFGFITAIDPSLYTDEKIRNSVAVIAGKLDSFQEMKQETIEMLVATDRKLIEKVPEEDREKLRLPEFEPKTLDETKKMTNDKVWKPELSGAVWQPKNATSKNENVRQRNDVDDLLSTL